MSFDIAVQKFADEVPTIAMKGEVDLYTAPKLKQQMLALMEDGARVILIDLSLVDYLDSTALGVLIGGLKRMRELDGNVILLCPAPRIRRVFDVTGLDRIFEVYDSESEVLEAIGKGN